MVFRVATTASILLTVAFTLQLISNLSNPVTKTISLCEYGGYNFGVFGYCSTSGECSDVGIGYDPSKLSFQHLRLTQSFGVIYYGLIVFSSRATAIFSFIPCVIYLCN